MAYNLPLRLIDREKPPKKQKPLASILIPEVSKQTFKQID